MISKWLNIHQEVFKKLKDLLTNPPLIHISIETNLLLYIWLMVIDAIKIEIAGTDYK